MISKESLIEVIQISRLRALTYPDHGNPRCWICSITTTSALALIQGLSAF